MLYKETVTRWIGLNTPKESVVVLNTNRISNLGVHDSGSIYQYSLEPNSRRDKPIQILTATTVVEIVARMNDVSATSIMELSFYPDNDVSQTPETRYVRDADFVMAYALEGDPTKSRVVFDDIKGTSIVEESLTDIVGEDSIPAYNSALVWLDGEVSGDEFVDQTGNGRNFTITGKDWDSGSYFPYKSAATISAPAGDATLIAADVNNFLYTAGTPNEIPVVSFFQNIDYEDKIFCRHIAQVTDGDGVETTEPSIGDICVYDSVLAGADLTLAETYYGVPINTETVTVKPSGGVYSTFEACLAAADLSIVGIYTKLYAETPAANYFLLNKEHDYIGRGRVVIDDGGNSTVGILRPYNKTVSMKGVELTVKTAADQCINIDGANFTFENFKLTGDGQDAMFLLNEASFGTCTIKNGIINGYSVRMLDDIPGTSGTFIIDSNIINSYSTNRVIDFAGDGVLTIKNNKVIFDNVLAEYFQSAVAQSLTYSLIGNTFQIDNCVDSMQIINLTGLLTDVTVIGNKVNIAAITKTLIQIFIVKNNPGITIKNNIITSEATTALTGIYLGTTGDSAINCVAENNRIVAKNATGSYGILIGSDGYDITHLNECDGGEIRFNREIGNYIYDTGTPITIHGSIIGWNTGAIRHNFISGFHYGAISKNDEAANAHVFGNIFIDNYYGVYVKGADSVNVSNNTIINKSLAGSVGILNLQNADGGRSGNPAKAMVAKNNIVIDEQGTAGGLVDITENASFPHVLDYNIYYSAAAKPFSKDGVDKTFAEWQALGYDTNSVMLSSLAAAKALFNDYDNDGYGLRAGSAAIGAGETLTGFEEGLEESTDWGDESTVPEVITKQQTTPWDIGAYVS